MAGRRPKRSTIRNTKTAVPQALMMPKIPVARRPVLVPLKPMELTMTYKVKLARCLELHFVLYLSCTYRTVVVDSVDTRQVLKNHQSHASEKSASGVCLPDLLDFGSKAEADTRSFVFKLAADGIDFPVDVFVVFGKVANVGQNAAYFLPATLLCQEARRFGLQ